MFEILDAVYLNTFEEQDSCSIYRDLAIGVRQSFQDFKTQFIYLANSGNIPEADRFNDIYNKMITAL